MSDEMICTICESSFRSNVMADGKCSLCNELYPDAKTKEDIKKKGKDIAVTLTDERVKELVYEILEEANLKRVKCDKCNKLFYRNSPAQKMCKVCKDKETK